MATINQIVKSVKCSGNVSSVKRSDIEGLFVVKTDNAEDAQRITQHLRTNGFPARTFPGKVMITKPGMNHLLMF